MNKIPVIALTGGPHSGKTTILNAVAEAMPEAYCVNEAATMLLSGGFPVPSEKHPWSYQWQKDFERPIIALHYSLESIAKSRAEAEGKQWVVVDRGLLDVASYLEKGVKELEEMTNETEAAMLERYDLVIHLPSVIDESMDARDGNQHRFEQITEIINLEKKTWEAWQNHPKRVLVDDGEAKARIEAVVKVTAEFIANN